MRGVTLEEISAATRISIRFLEAIESEALSKLPGGIFTRSFVRSYARFLGLDEERVLTDCQLAGRQKPEVDIHRIAANRAQPERRGFADAGDRTCGSSGAAGRRLCAFPPFAPRPGAACERTHRGSAERPCGYNDQSGRKLFDRRKPTC